MEMAAVKVGGHAAVRAVDSRAVGSEAKAKEGHSRVVNHPDRVSRGVRVGRLRQQASALAESGRNALVVVEAKEQLNLCAVIEQ